ncbi:MAG: c-type cytochrome biogenesis protein CcmI, partial [Brevundimonas sp.]
MTAFWILCALAAALAAWAVLFASRHALTPSSGTADAGRAELDELDRLRDRGLIDPQAWAEARAEAGRRLLADRPAEPVAAFGSRVDRLGVVLGAGLAVLAAVAIYALVGRPGYADQ